MFFALGKTSFLLVPVPVPVQPCEGMIYTNRYRTTLTSMDDNPDLILDTLIACLSQVAPMQTYIAPMPHSLASATIQ